MEHVKDNDVAFLAAMNGKALNNLVNFPGADSRELNTYKRVDWRNFVDTKVPPPHLQQPQYHQQPQPVYDYSTPINNQVVNQQYNHPPQFIPVPVIGPDGQITTQPFQPQQPGSTYASPQSPLQTTGFELPSFGGPQQATKTKPVDDDIIKELKSLKKAINKLTRMVESAILGPQPKPLDDPKDTQENTSD
jgi:hypothetical protein